MKLFSELLLILGLFLVTVNCHLNPIEGEEESDSSIDDFGDDDDTVIEFAFYAT